jgi:hypothetical protein
MVMAVSRLQGYASVPHIRRLTIEGTYDVYVRHHAGQAGE